MLASTTISNFISRPQFKGKRTRTMRVLIVEDDEKIVSLITKGLKLFFYSDHPVIARKPAWMPG
jgi:hypothetical protein